MADAEGMWQKTGGMKSGIAEHIELSILDTYCLNY